MTRWVVSDLHLLDGTAADHFASCAFHFFLDEFLKPDDEIIEVGDGQDFELADNWHDIAKAHSMVFKKIIEKTSKYVIVKGNHNPNSHDITSLLEAALDGERAHNVEQLINERKIIISDIYQTGKYLFVHGHQVDPEIAKHPGLAWAVGKIGGVIERTVYPDAGIWFQKVNAWIQRTGKHGKDEDYFREITNWANKVFQKIAQIEILFFGHTHQYGFAINKSAYPKLLINTGCFVDKGNLHTAIAIEDDGRIKAFHFDDVKLLKTEVISG